MTRITAVIFSDLGLAASFMSLAVVQRALGESLGFEPFPATLNVRPQGADDSATWRRLRAVSAGRPLAIAEPGFCSARLYPVVISRAIGARDESMDGAVIVPEVDDYPSEKIEIVAPVRLKQHWGVSDGDALTLEFST
jgi:riboflavin kinase